MGILSDLSKLGVNVDMEHGLYGNNGDRDRLQQKKAEEDSQNLELLQEQQEMELIHDRNFTCKACGREFVIKVLRNAKIRRAPSDEDLRPRAEKIDILKYEAISCPYCGYSAMTRYYDRITNYQLKLIKENISATFEPQPVYGAPTYSYEYAVRCYQMGLANAVVKKAKASEKAHYCLNIAWLLRDEAAQFPPGEAYEEVKAKEEQYYRQAYDGLLLAMREEMYPICGMNQNTAEYLIGYMAAHFREYTVASKLISGVLTNRTTPNRLKDRALELKQRIIAEIRKGQGK